MLFRSDGGKHTGSTNFPLSYILTASPEFSAKMARLTVEFTEKAFSVYKENEDKNETEKIKVYSTIEELTKAYGFDDTNDFLFSLQTELELPKKTRDIYLYLPYSMLNIYPTVKVFSNMDLMTGKQVKAPFFFVSRNLTETNDLINLGQNISIRKNGLSLVINNKNVPLKRFVKTGYTNNKFFVKELKEVDLGAKLSVIYMSAYNTFLVIDELTFNSLYIQLMVLERYDRKLFEQVSINAHAKIYKLRI